MMRLTRKRHRLNFQVIGHRGNGMNVMESADLRFNTTKENTILSFNTARDLGVNLVEFDVQVTKDGVPVIFHDTSIFWKENGREYEQRIREISVAEFLNFGHNKNLLKETKGGQKMDWVVETDDVFCTLQDAFSLVKSGVGFNIELKLDQTKKEELKAPLEAILAVILLNGNNRNIIFSSFNPTAALYMKELRKTYCVFFLTEGGITLHQDKLMNSLDEAMDLCRKGGLNGIVSDARALLKNPEKVDQIKKLKLCLMSYGKLK